MKNENLLRSKEHAARVNFMKIAFDNLNVSLKRLVIYYHCMPRARKCGCRRPTANV